MTRLIHLSTNTLEKFYRAVLDTTPVTGLTHNLYRYPARFSPRFVHEAILAFSKPGDVVIDPFMGGGTTLVESLALSRHCLGSDVSPLAVFVSQAKTTVVNEIDLEQLIDWSEEVITRTRAVQAAIPSLWSDGGYQKDIPWPIRKSIEGVLNEIPSLSTQKLRHLATCIVLKTAQWAIDCRDETPSAEDFRARFQENVQESVTGMNELKAALGTIRATSNIRTRCYCLNVSATDLKDSAELKRLPAKPKLVITSPPYPGVHVVYHQWQVNSRRRTLAPFWIIGSPNGHGSAHYTFGYYKSHTQKEYFEIAQSAFSAIRTIVDDEALVVQLIGFSDPKKHLSKYLSMMDEAGFEEVVLAHDSIGRTRRLWRDIPNRKWYADTREDSSSSREVVLIHRLK